MWYLYAALVGMRCHGMSPRPSTPSQTRDEDPVECETRLPRHWTARGGTGHGKGDMCGMYSLAGAMLGEVPAAHHTRHKTCHPNSIYRLYRTGMA